MKTPEDKAKAALEMQLADTAVTLIKLDGEFAKHFPIEDSERHDEWSERLAHAKAILENRIEEYRKEYGDDYKLGSRDRDDNASLNLKGLFVNWVQRTHPDLSDYAGSIVLL